MLKRFLGRLRWLLRQLLPLTYRTYYGRKHASAFQVHFAVWKMWLGRCYGMDDVVLDVCWNVKNPKAMSVVDNHYGISDLPKIEHLNFLMDQIEVLRLLFESKLNQIKSDDELSASMDALRDLSTTMVTLCGKANKMERNLGKFMRRSAVTHFIHSFVSVVDKEIQGLSGGEDAMKRISEYISKEIEKMSEPVNPTRA